MLDILIPVYNEGENIKKVLDALGAAVRTPFQVLVAYDDDRDDTLAALESYRNPRVKIVPVKNTGRGVHGAIVSGFQHGRSDAVIVLPADDTYNAVIIDEMVRRFEQGADIVAASRFMPGGCMKGCPVLKATLVRLAAFLMHHLGRVPAHDPTNGFRLFSRRVLDRVPIESTEGFAFSLELLAKTHRLKWKVAEVPAQWLEMEGRTSRFRVFKWLPIYLRWFFYVFATVYLRRGPATVTLK